MCCLPTATAAATGSATGGSDHADPTSDSPGPGSHALPVGYHHYHHHVNVAPAPAASHATPHTSTLGPTPRSAPFCPDAAGLWMGTWPGESPRETFNGLNCFKLEDQTCKCYTRPAHFLPKECIGLSVYIVDLQFLKKKEKTIGKGSFFLIRNQILCIS